MRVLGLLIVVSLGIGCGAGVPFRPRQTCTISQATFLLEEPGECGYYQAVVADAEHALTSDVGLSSDRAAALIASRTVWVHRDNVGFVCADSDDAVLGCNHDRTGDIEVTVTAGALLHELLHALDKANGVPLEDSQKHAGWDARSAIAAAPRIATPAGGVLPGSWLDLSDNAIEGWVKVYYGDEKVPADGVVTTPSYWYLSP